MAEKLFYTMGEVSELFDVNPSLLRYWEEQFPALKPKRNKKGNRLYSPQDLETLKTIYHLVKERGMKIEGARKALRDEQRTARVVRNADLMERLQRIRALLAEVREELKSDAEPPRPEAVGQPERPEQPEPSADEAAAAETPAAQPVEHENKTRRPRRKKEENENKELFAFYEQSLF